MKLKELITLDPNNLFDEKDRKEVENLIETELVALKSLRNVNRLEPVEFDKYIAKFNSIKAHIRNQRLKEGLITQHKKVFTDNYTVIPNGYTLAHFDGSVSKNPGGLAVGGAVIYLDGTKKTNYCTQSDSTNNVAEYLGLIAVLELGLELGIKRLFIKGDSELIVNQVNDNCNRSYGRLIPYYKRVKQLIKNYDSVIIVHVRRVFNKEVNKFTYDKMKELIDPIS